MNCDMFSPIILHAVWSTIGMLTLSVCLTVCPSVRPSVTLCIVAKRYILQQKCLNKWIGNAPYEQEFTTFIPYTDPEHQKNYAT